MAIVVTYYGDITEANDYFNNRLHEEAWSSTPAADRPKALWAATLIIDALNFKVAKNAVYTLLQSNPSAADADIRAATRVARAAVTLVARLVKMMSTASSRNAWLGIGKLAKRTTGRRKPSFRTCSKRSNSVTTSGPSCRAAWRTCRSSCGPRKRPRSMNGYANLFKSNVVAGVGANSATVGLAPGSNGRIDVRKMTPEQYAKLRKESPELLGL